MAIRVLEETGLLPHLNPGVMSWAEMSRLKPVAPSMGMMLETTSRRLFETKGLAHYGSPDKDPEVRLRTLTDNLPEGAIYRYRHDAHGEPHIDFISAGIERLTGVPAADFMSDGATVERTIVPEDRARLRAAIALSR